MAFCKVRRFGRLSWIERLENLLFLFTLYIVFLKFSRTVSRADVTKNKTDERKYYYGISDTSIKDCYENHKMLSRHKSHLTVSYLFMYYWKLVRNVAVPTIKFSTAKHVKGNTFINNCNLCLIEKPFIIRNLDDVNMLKQKTRIYIKVSRYK